MRMLRSVGIWAATGGMMLVLGGVGWSQMSGTGSGQGTGGGGGRLGGQTTSSGAAATPIMPAIGPDTPLSPQTEEEQAKMRNSERQKQLIEDTQKLLSLANELKADVDKSTKDTLSLDVVKKADEIEKLAHNVKEKMKCSACSPSPALMP
jgi:hypothetical protein